MMRSSLLLAFSFAVALAPVAGAANQVHVVDAAGGSGGHTTIQAAVDAASDGDVVLVRPGTYGAFDIQAKGIAVLADPGPSGARPRVERVAVWSIAAAQRVTLRGLEIRQTPGFFAPPEALSVAGCSGALVVEDCEVFGGKDHAASVTASRVLFVRSVLVPWDGGSGLFSSFATLHVVDSTLFGSKGQNAAWNGAMAIPAGEGFPAIWLGASSLVLAGGTLTGGAGGDGLFAPNGTCVPGGAGGPALFAFGGAEASHGDVTLVGGAGGVAGSGCSNGGAAGASVKAQNALVTSWTESLRTVVVSSPVREGAAAQIDVTGTPGEPAFLLIGAAPALEFLPFHFGTLLPATFFVSAVGALPPSGHLTVTVPIAPATLPAGIDVLEAYVQAIVPGSTGQGVLGSGSVVAVLDGTF